MKSKTKLAEKIKYHNWTPDILVFFSYINRQGSTNCFKQCGIYLYCMALVHESQLI